MAKRTILLLFFLAAALTIVFAHGMLNDGDPDAFIRREAFAVQSRTTPAGASASDLSEISRTTWSASVSWRVETHQEWAEYSQWLTEQLMPDFRVIRITGTSADFGKQLPADALQVWFDVEGEGIRVVFTSYAD